MGRKYYWNGKALSEDAFNTRLTLRAQSAKPTTSVSKVVSDTPVNYADEKSVPESIEVAVKQKRTYRNRKPRKKAEIVEE